MAEALSAEFKDSGIKDFLGDIKNRLKDVEGGERKYAGLLSAIIFQDVMTHFKDQKGSDGPWKTWSPAYRKHMDRKGKGGNNILQDSGKLRQSFQPSNYKYQSKGLTWFNNAKTKDGYPYAWGHDTGDGKLPQRDFMWLSNPALDKVAEKTLQFMLDEGV